MRYCIVCFEMIGPIRNGGIGTAYTALAQLLAKAGHDVSFLFVRPHFEYGSGANNTIRHWQSIYRKKGVTLCTLPAAVELEGITPWSDQWILTISTLIREWILGQDRFDLVHFPEHLGLAYSLLKGKQEELLFSDTVVCIGVHGSHAWLRQIHKWIKPTRLLDHLESQSVELADLLWSPSHYMIKWLISNGWRLPERVLVRPYLLPPNIEVSTVEPGSSRRFSPKELVFFGRLEGRKGLALFCDVLDLLDNDLDEKIKITFMGRHAEVEGRASAEYLAERISKWSWRSQVLDSLDQPEALDYLKHNNCLAVIASPVDNSPNTVYECLGLKIPFLACHSGGIPELIASDDLSEVTFPYSSEALYQKLICGLRHGFVVARSAFSFAQNEGEWVKWHEQVCLGRGCLATKMAS